MTTDNDAKLETLMQFARAGYATGRIKPTQHDSCSCVLGATYLGMYGKLSDGSFCDKLNISLDFVIGTIDGFDDNGYSPSNSQYHKGYEFGERARQEFIR